MKVTVFGIGYVGLVQAAVLADLGNSVTCVDVDSNKIELLKQGVIPIHEPGLDGLVKSNYAAGRLNFTTSAVQGVTDAEIIFIAVGTPMDEDGSADLKYVLKVAETIGEHLQRYCVIVTKSTVPVGTGDLVENAISEVLSKRSVELDFDVVSNPEFLKEGAAVADCSKPDRIILGTDSEQALELMNILYAPFNRNHQRTIVMDRRSAELTKYAANCMLATKISFMNEMSNVAEEVGADIEMVRNGMGSDPRIGYHFIYPGCGYGGSCFPKDVSALINTASQYGYEARILKSVEQVNQDQKNKLLGMIHKCYGERLVGKRFALWGASFKPNTDDIREAPSLVVIRALLDAGATVVMYDPVANEPVCQFFENDINLKPVNDAFDALQDADGLIICTEWKVFKAPDFDKVKKRLAAPVIFDGRNLYDPEYMASLGIEYYGIGRGKSVKGYPS
ncbi:UDP-glucose/GDP-mannose dehydrogenase family protein [Paraneptunicella aestuarii]|uniref:UDP-glucose dehydrogenase family protein n=1 Tax=Paraneptunicella aestuarii TaxID=2831148 RepID=UPI001E30A82A|nr:UDP-glucose/GDP-mannose dehydrogenase family protein [Paraneptunicella aestuarii]UAA39686.1 UDP-glucose/GDP-mannose dehydrogenase family protein [Paraneptunicella aestuarii]